MHPVTFADVNKAEGDNTNWKETVQEVDEEVEAYAESTNTVRAAFIDNPADNQSSRNIGQTYRNSRIRFFLFWSKAAHAATPYFIDKDVQK